MYNINQVARIINAEFATTLALLHEAFGKEKPLILPSINIDIINATPYLEWALKVAVAVRILGQKSTRIIGIEDPAIIGNEPFRCQTRRERLQRSSGGRRHNMRNRIAKFSIRFHSNNGLIKFVDRTLRQVVEACR
jgi:hypothetical protein